MQRQAYGLLKRSQSRERSRAAGTLSPLTRHVLSAQETGTRRTRSALVGPYILLIAGRQILTMDMLKRHLQIVHAKENENR